MRKSLLCLLLVALAACGRAEGQLQSVPAASVTPAIGLDDAAARDAVRAFVQAYADAPADQGKSLFPLASGSLMFRWIRWSAIENRAFPGTITGSASIDSIGPIHALRATMSDGSTVALPGVQLRASVTYHYAAADGGETSKTYSLDGLVAMVSSAPGSWQIQQFTQNGQQLADFVVPVDLPSSSGDVRVVFDTLMISPDHWTIGVLASNQSSAEIPIKDALLTQPSGIPVARLQLIAPPSIPAGKTADILIRMPPQATISGDLGVELVAGTTGGDHPFVASLTRILSNMPSAPAPPASPPPASPA